MSIYIYIYTDRASPTVAKYRYCNIYEIYHLNCFATNLQFASPFLENYNRERSLKYASAVWLHMLLGTKTKYKKKEQIFSAHKMFLSMTESEPSVYCRAVREKKRIFSTGKERERERERPALIVFMCAMKCSTSHTHTYTQTRVVTWQSSHVTISARGIKEGGRGWREGVYTRTALRNCKHYSAARDCEGILPTKLINRSDRKNF